MLIPRQLAPTVGPAHGGVEFLEGSISQVERFTIFWMKKNRFGRIYNGFEFISQRSKEFFSDGLEKVEIKRN